MPYFKVKLYHKNYVRVKCLPNFMSADLLYILSYKFYYPQDIPWYKCFWTNLCEVPRVTQVTPLYNVHINSIILRTFPGITDSGPGHIKAEKELVGSNGTTSILQRQNCIS